MARRDQTPPYEIMRSRTASGTTPSGGSGGDDVGTCADPDSPADSPAVPGVPNKAPWWVGSSAPLVLRVPRGLALVAVAAVLLVIVVAYWVGSIRGAAGAQPDEPTAAIGDRPGPAGWYESEAEAYAGPDVEVPEDALEDERRESGLNYMRLIQSTREDCQELAKFFGVRGVAIQLVSVNNGEFYIAYAVKRGYRKDELGSESCKRYERELRALGRQWKAENSGRGTDLATMYFQRYDG